MNIESNMVKGERMRDAGYWMRQYRAKGAFWTHDGNPRRPHAILTAEKQGRKMHSRGFFDSELVMEDPFVLDKAAFDLVRSLERQGLKLNSVDRVIGPAMGAITLAHDVARRIGSSRSCPRPCLRSYAEKEMDGDGKRAFVFKRTAIRSRERVLLIEDVLTTGESIGLTAEAVIHAGGIVLPFVGALVNRSGFDEIGGKRAVALVDHPMPAWAPEKCPLCKGGSMAIRPKENWAILNA